MLNCFDCDEGPCYMNCGPAVPAPVACSFETAMSVARNNSRSQGSSWTVFKVALGYTASAGLVPAGEIVAIFRKGRKTFDARK
jgi:hypothetical protein